MSLSETDSSYWTSRLSVSRYRFTIRAACLVVDSVGINLHFVPQISSTALLHPFVHWGQMAENLNVGVFFCEMYASPEVFFIVTIEKTSKMKTNELVWQTHVWLTSPTSDKEQHLTKLFWLNHPELSLTQWMKQSRTSHGQGVNMTSQKTNYW